MANQPITKVLIDSERIRKAMEYEGISFRELSKVIGKPGASDRVIREYVNSGKCPPQLVYDLCTALHLSPSHVLFGPTVWMRLGVTVQVTDEEFEYFLEHEEDGCVEIDETMAQEFLKRAIADDDSYIPEGCIRHA